MVLLVIKYLKYYKERIKIPIMQAFEYRTDILMSSAGTYGYMIVSLVFINFLFSEFDDIAGWNKYEVIIIFVTSQFIFYIFLSFFSHIWGYLSEDIEDGKLDAYLLKPINTIFNVSTKDFLFVELVPSIILPVALFYLSLQQIDPINLGAFLLYAVSLTISFIIFYCMFFILQCLSFWLTDTRALGGVLLQAYSEFSKYPVAMYPKFTWPLFLVAIPVGLLAYAPSYILVKGFDPILFTLQIFVAVLFVSVSIAVWRKGLKAYSSASS